MANGFNLSDPATQRALFSLLGGLGSEIGGNQGVAGVLGGFAQDLVKAENFRNLIRTLGGTDAGAGAPTTPKTTKPTTPGTAGTVPRSKVMIEGGDMTEVGKMLSGLTLAQEGSQLPDGSGTIWGPGNIPNFLKPR